MVTWLAYVLLGLAVCEVMAKASLGSWIEEQGPGLDMNVPVLPIVAQQFYIQAGLATGIERTAFAT